MITFRQLGRYGRFANGLFQIAGTIGIATKNGYSFAFPKWVNHDHRNFSATEDIDVQKHFVNELPYAEDLERYPERFVHWGFHGFDVPDNISLVGHFQAPRYFAHCMDTVRHYFRMKDEPDPNEYVAIHFRGKDYYEGKHNYHPQCSREYYEKAMNHFEEGTVFYVFTDDIPAAQNIFNGLPVKIISGDYMEDFKLMKCCKSFIIANSSFSLMAALLGEHPDKKIICPSLWFGEEAGPHMNGNDCYPENAIVI
jgi:hypothetical protein